MLLVCLIWGMNFSITKWPGDQIPPLAFHRGPLRDRESAALAGAAAWWRGRRGFLRVLLDAWSCSGAGKHLLSAGLHRGLGPDHRHQQRADPVHRAYGGGGVRRTAWIGADHTPDALGIALGTVGVILVIATRGVGFHSRHPAGRPDDPGGGFLLGRLHHRASPGSGRHQLAPGYHRYHHRGHPRPGSGGHSRSPPPGLGRGPSGCLARLGYAAVFSLVFAYLLWNRSVKAVGGTRTAIYMCVTPLVAVARRLAAAGRTAPSPAGHWGRVHHRGGLLRGRVVEEREQRSGDRSPLTAFTPAHALLFHYLLVALRIPCGPLGRVARSPVRDKTAA